MKSWILREKMSRDLQMVRSIATEDGEECRNGRVRRRGERGDDVLEKNVIVQLIQEKARLVCQGRVVFQEL